MVRVWFVLTNNPLKMRLRNIWGIGFELLVMPIFGLLRCTTTWDGEQLMQRLSRFYTASMTSPQRWTNRHVFFCNRWRQCLRAPTANTLTLLSETKISDTGNPQRKRLNRLGLSYTLVIIWHKQRATISRLSRFANLILFCAVEFRSNDGCMA